jgi:hypothetical protein
MPGLRHTLAWMPLRWFGSALLFVGLGTACGNAAVGPRPTSVSAAPALRADLTQNEWRELEAGRPVHHERQLTRGDQRYLGTVSYQLVKASPGTILGALGDVDALPELLPQTKRATLVDGNLSARRVELVQGNDWVTARYTVILAGEPQGGLRFELDRTRRHDIDDAWGYFRAERFDRDRSLVTVGVAVDIGSGVFRFLFENAVQNVILNTPDQVRRYTERRESEQAALARRTGLAGPLASR